MRKLFPFIRFHIAPTCFLLHSMYTLFLAAPYHVQHARIYPDLKSHRHFMESTADLPRGKRRGSLLVTSIIILTHNQLAYTKACIESVRTYTQRGTYECIVVDNTSTDGTRPWLQKQSDIYVIANEQNVGFPKGCNQGIQQAKGDTIVLLNNDVVVTKNWLPNLLRCLYADEKTAAVGPVTNQASYYSSIPVSYQTLSEMQQFASAYNQLNQTQWEQRLKLIGFCMVMKKEVLQQVGLLDERFSPGNYEDDDLSLRMRQHGYHLYLCRDTFVHHFGSQSWKEDIPRFQRILEKNESVFYQKWGLRSHDLSIHYPIFSPIDAIGSHPFSFLQIGSGCGATLLAMKQKYPQAQVWGVESNKKAALFSQQIAPTYCVSYEQLHTVDLKQRFSIILVSTVLLEAEWQELQPTLFQLLKRDGKLFVLSEDGSIQEIEEKKE